jgi:murein DD-endopeptidase MepM/ murein hydrolase activator NlpD
VQPGEVKTRLVAAYVPGPQVTRVAYEFVLQDDTDEPDMSNVAYWAPDKTACPYGTLPETPGELILARWPVEGYVVTSSFGCTEYFTGVKAAHCPPNAPWFHEGIDLGVPAGTTYYDTLSVDSTVDYAGPDSDGADCSDMVGAEEPRTGLGYYVQQSAVVNDHEVVIWGGHLSALSVTSGSTTTPGQMLGQTGSTGCSSGPHLHFAVAIDGMYVDPMAILP